MSQQAECRFSRTGMLQTTFNQLTGHGAIADVVSNVAIADALDDRAADFFRKFIVFRLDRIGAIVPGA